MSRHPRTSIRVTEEERSMFIALGWMEKCSSSEVLRTLICSRFAELKAHNESTTTTG